jgi:glycosyltransferase involved in cell wall biosynthesis
VLDVTVVIPTRDRPGLLASTLRSVLRQEQVDLEVIVVDDGSTDPVVVGALPEVQAPEVTVIRNPCPSGVAAARNRGIERASSTWIATLDDDDLWPPDKLRRQLEAVHGTGRDWVYGGAVHFLPGPQPWHIGAAPAETDIQRRLAHENLVPAGSSNVLARRESLCHVEGFDEDLPHLADWDMWCKLLRMGPPAVIPEFVVAYRLHPQNMVLRSSDGIHDEADIIECRTEDLRGGEPMDRTGLHFWIASMNMRAGRRSEARRAYLRAVRAGNRRAALHAARTLVPMNNVRASVLRKQPPPWPPGFDTWLRLALSDE